MQSNSHFKISGWVLPCGNWINCNPWEHIKKAKEINYIIESKDKNQNLHLLWNHPDDELLRAELAKIGMIKVCYKQIDADSVTPSQLTKLQELFSLCSLDEDIEFIGRIKLKIQVRLFLKIKDVERLNRLY
ncbi:hypothetical protein [Silvanigrella aquatica]|nr:hypothetical protein [Silvanigrella aquatica]